MKFNRNLLFEMELPDEALERKIIGTGRWSIHYEIIFKYNDKFYRTTYQEGATEQQDESPWEYEPEVECTEVKQVEKLVKVWEPVNA